LLIRIKTAAVTLLHHCSDTPVFFWCGSLNSWHDLMSWSWVGYRSPFSDTSVTANLCSLFTFVANKRPKIFYYFTFLKLFVKFNRSHPVVFINIQVFIAIEKHNNYRQ
jgi:hypothetical protein